MKIKANDIRRGMVITMDNVNFVVVDFHHHTPGNLRAQVQTKLRNMNSGSIIDKRLRSVDEVEVPFVENREYQYLYSSGDEHVFMDNESFDQISFGPDIVGTALKYVLPNTNVVVTFIDDKAISIDIPPTVELTVTECPPGFKGNTVNNTYKEATLETGLQVMVPMFIDQGERVKIDTRTGEYLERVK